MSEDELRDQLVKAWTRHDWDHGRRPETKPWEKLDAKTQQRLTDRIETLYGDRLDDALMPVVREALAELVSTTKEFQELCTINSDGLSTWDFAGMCALIEHRCKHWFAGVSDLPDEDC